jgi:hypothetical protein
MLNITQIPALRVDFIDPKTGLISREWYRFLLSLFNQVDSSLSLDDVQVGPTVEAHVALDTGVDTQVNTLMAQYDMAAALIDGLAVSPIVEPIPFPDQLAPSVQLGTMAAQNAENPTLGGGATLLSTATTLTNGAAAAAGTLLNAPAAGNPTKWFAINDAGTVRYVPAW